MRRCQPVDVSGVGADLPHFGHNVRATNTNSRFCCHHRDRKRKPWKLQRCLSRNVRLLGNITTNGPGSVTYRWERSDGATGQTETLNFTGAGTQTVTNSWQLSANGSFWERVHVLTPNDTSSNDASFTNNCGGGGFAVTATTASVSPSTYSGACPGMFDFLANITTNGAAVSPIGGSVVTADRPHADADLQRRRDPAGRRRVVAARRERYVLGARACPDTQRHFFKPGLFHEQLRQYPLCRHGHDRERESQHLQRRLSGHVQLPGGHHDQWRGQCHRSVGAW